LLLADAVFERAPLKVWVVPLMQGVSGELSNSEYAAAKVGVNEATQNLKRQ
jgi:hypothetical protein